MTHVSEISGVPKMSLYLRKCPPCHKRTSYFDTAQEKLSYETVELLYGTPVIPFLVVPQVRLS